MQKWQFLRKGARSRGFPLGEVIMYVLGVTALSNALCPPWEPGTSTSLCSCLPRRRQQDSPVASALALLCMGTSTADARAPSTHLLTEGRFWQQEQTSPQAPKAGSWGKDVQEGNGSWRLTGLLHRIISNDSLFTKSYMRLISSLL